MKLKIILFHAGRLPLRDLDLLRLQFLGARNLWLGCPYSVCDLRNCPSTNNKYADFKECGGEGFQIINDGTQGSVVKSGQRIRLYSLSAGTNPWMGCPLNNRCSKRFCPGTIEQGRNFSRCGGEILRMYARGRTNGQTIYNGDVVMLYYSSVSGDGYVSIQGENNGDDTSLNFCPGQTPPAYFSYGLCSKNAFRIYRKP